MTELTGRAMVFLSKNFIEETSGGKKELSQMSLAQKKDCLESLGIEITEKDSDSCWTALLPRGWHTQKTTSIINIIDETGRIRLVQVNTPRAYLKLVA